MHRIQVEQASLNSLLPCKRSESISETGITKGTMMQFVRDKIASISVTVFEVGEL